MARIPTVRWGETNVREMRLGSIPIADAWLALGGESLRGKRGKAFWRDGDGYNIALDTTKGTWFDHRDGRGGGVLGLVETALGCTRSAALQWLETNCGLDPLRQISPDQRRNYRQERDDSEHFGIAAKALAEHMLDRLDACNPERVDYTRLIRIVRAGGTALIEEFGTWLESDHDLTRAMVRAGESSIARMQRRLAFFLLEVANAA